MPTVGGAVEGPGTDPEARAAFAMWVTGMVVIGAPLVLLRLIARRLLRRAAARGRR